MKWFAKYRSSLKYKIFFSMIILLLIPYVTLNLYFYATAESIIEEKIISAMSKALQQTSINIENLISRTTIGANIVADSAEVKEFMDGTGTQSVAAAQKNQIALYQLGHTVQSNVLTSDAEIILVGDNGGVFSTSVVSPDVFQTISASPWFQKARQHRYFYSWVQLTGRDLCKLTSPDMEYMVMCRVVSDYRGNGCGMVLVLFQRSRVYDLLNSLTSGSSESFFIVTNEGEMILTSHNLEQEKTLDEKYRPILDRETGHYILERSGGKYLLNFCSVSMLNWKIAVQSPYDFIFAEIQAMRRKVIVINLIIIFLFCALLFWQFNHFLQPIFSMLGLIHSVEKGDLTHRIKVTTEDELGVLGNHLNEMVTNLGSLLEENYEKQQELALKEKEKETMRYLVLQSQINPHFFFNSLNNIKWLAQINRDKQVADSISSLGRLLEASIRNLEDEIPLNQEIDYLKDYLEIMELSRPGKFQTSYQIDPSAGVCLVPKLILQPLVENAIIHGLDGSNELGQIKIAAYRKEAKLLIEVCDNGIGFDRQQINRLLTQKIRMNRMGIGNTDQRIKLNYGEEYGLKFLEVQPQGTCVIVTLPIRAGREKEGSE